MTPRRRTAGLLTALIVGFAIMVLVDPSLRTGVGYLLHIGTIGHVRSVVRAWGFWGPFLVVVLMVLHSVVFVPAEIITLASIVIFGPVWGVVYAWVGAMLGASLSFLLARLWGRPLVLRFVPGAVVSRLDAFFQRESAVGMLTLRLIPLVSFNALNYAGGLTPMTWWRFLWTTGVGILPMEVVLAVLYHSARGKTDAIVGLTIVGLALLLGLVFRTRVLAKYRGPVQKPGGTVDRTRGGSGGTSHQEEGNAHD